MREAERVAREAAVRAVFQRDWATVADRADTEEEDRAEDDALAAVYAYLASMAAQGFVMVPVEPTEAMVQMGYVRDPLGCDVEEGDRETIYGAIYSAMIAARPREEDK